MSPLCLSLFGKGRHTLLLVFGAKSCLEYTSLVEETLRQSHIISHVDAFLGHRDRWSRLLRNLSPNLKCLVHELISWYNSAHETSICCFLSIHHITSEDHFHSSAFTNSSCQSLCASHAWNSPQINFWLAKFGSLSSN